MKKLVTVTLGYGYELRLVDGCIAALKMLHDGDVLG